MTTQALAFAAALASGTALEPPSPTLVPRLAGKSWTAARNPDLGRHTSPHQQPVDFAIWQAADSTWQLWSCIRGTRCGGKTRLFHRWEGRSLTESDWQPQGIAMEADPTLGETAGGLQAPHVVKAGDLYLMAYGDWEHICLATSRDGKRFERRLGPGGKTGMFTQGAGSNTRDPMLLHTRGLWHCYYTAFPAGQGAVYCRTSKDLVRWSDEVTVAFGGRAGVGPSSAECPHAVCLAGRYYLFRTQRYGLEAQTSVYHSTDPLLFGINQDERYLLARLPVAAPELIFHEEQWFIASLRPELDGIQIQRLEWVEAGRTSGGPPAAD